MFWIVRGNDAVTDEENIVSYIQWSKEFELGISEFDEHHKHLVDLLNKTYNNFINGASRDELEAVLDELIDYAIYHFSAEEQWMGTNEYPGLTQHCEEHDRFSRRVLDIQSNFHNGFEELSLELLLFLNNWMVGHILKADAEYACFAKGLPHDAT